VIADVEEDAWRWQAGDRLKESEREREDTPRKSDSKSTLRDEESSNLGKEVFEVSFVVTDVEKGIMR
jgi:hypothetical protein